MLLVMADFVGYLDLTPPRNREGFPNSPFPHKEDLES